MIIGSGCAKKELVKTEEPVPVQQPVAQQPEVTQPVQPEPAVSQPVPVVTEQKVPEQQAVAPAPAPKVKIDIADIYFTFDSYVLDAAARETLSKGSELLKQSAGAKIRIEGNCDDRGSEEYNLALGEKRARAALKYLVTLGVSEDNLSFVSYGENKPADPGQDEASRAKNRNDHFVIVSE
jgi:peptidoglycan-associated lipoprotein